MVFELRRGIEREANKTRKLLSGLLARAFDDVRRDRHRGPYDLIAERGVIGTANSGRDTPYTQRESVCFPPDLQLLEIAHAPNVGAFGRTQTSFDARSTQIVAR